MSDSTLCLHRGARHVGRQELVNVPVPDPTDTWFPVRHAEVLDTAVNRLQEAGYMVRRSELALNQSNTQFFGVLDLDSPVAAGVHLAVGIRNSIDRTFPMGFVAGHRVFVCDNLALRSELLVKRKHTRNGQLRFANAITQAVTALSSFKEAETVRIQRMADTGITTERAESLILRAYMREVISFRLLPEVIKQWNEPAYEEWGRNTLWHLFNAFTWAMADVFKRNPNGYATRTMQLNNLLCPIVDAPQAALAA